VNLETVDELMEVWSSSNSNSNNNNNNNNNSNNGNNVSKATSGLGMVWRLTAAEVRKVLALRIDDFDLRLVL
jgi:hypothetical protein